MTSSNVSNLPFQVGIVSPETVDVKCDVSKANGLFEKTLQIVAGNNATSQTKPVELPKTISEKPVESVSSKLNSTNDSKLAKVDDSKVEDSDVISEKIEEVAGKIKEVIEEELDVTEEDLEKAMEALGFVAIDLFNPQNLAELVSMVTGEDDSISLIMSDEFKSILDTVNDLTTELFKETGIDLENIKQFVVSTDEVEPEVDLSVIKDTEINNEIVHQINREIEIEVEDVTPIQVEVKDTKEIQKEVVEVKNTEEDIPVVQLQTANASQGQEADDSFKNNTSANPDSVKQAYKPAEKEQVRPEAAVINQPKVEPEFVAEQKVVTLPTGQTVSADDIVNQLVEQARVLNTTESTTMEMTLNPEGLGRIFLEVTQKGNEITAKIFTENDAVKNALESQMATLRLETNQGSSKVTSIEVSVGTHEFERNLEENSQNEQRRDNQAEQAQKKTRGINLNSLDDLSGLMSDEDMLIAQMMKDNGNTLDFQA